MNLLDINQLLPTTSVENKWGQQMRIQILILGFEGLRRDSTFSQNSDTSSKSYIQCTVKPTMQVFNLPSHGRSA